MFKTLKLTDTLPKIEKIGVSVNWTIYCIQRIGNRLYLRGVACPDSTQVIRLKQGWARKQFFRFLFLSFLFPFSRSLFTFFFPTFFVFPFSRKKKVFFLSWREKKVIFLFPLRKESFFSFRKESFFFFFKLAKSKT